MFFKNLCAYRLTGWPITTEQLFDALATQAFQPCGALAHESTGWAPPQEGGLLVHKVDDQLLLQLTTETKILPASVINQHAKERAEELAVEQGFKPDRKQFRELKEKITDELLPRALAKRSSVRVWIDPKNKWLAIDTASGTRADQVIRVLAKTLGFLPLTALRFVRSPRDAMTTCLVIDEAPAGFTVDRDADLRATQMSKATVKYRNKDLDADDIRQHVAGGMQCVQLGLTFGDRVSFMLNEDGMLKRLHFLDIVRDGANYGEKDDVERFNADFLIMAGECNKLLGALVAALGGEDIQEAA